jgi:hypothetical protein
MENLAELKNQNRIRCRRIGRALIDGPSAIFPPASIDDYGWLEADFRLIIRWPDYDRRESLHVFCDGSMNRDDNFLAPMIRRCVWTTSADLDGANDWPNATVEIGHIHNPARVDALLRLVHRAISKLPFAELGLSLARDSVDIEIDNSEPKCSIWARNGMQCVEYWSEAVPQASLGLSFRQIHADLLAELDPVQSAGWRERYDYDLRQEPRARWDCEPGAHG